MRTRDIPLVAVLYASLTATGAILALAEYTSIIRTTGGPLRGEILRTARKSQEFASFKGIPYAEPPLGHLRFKVRCVIYCARGFACVVRYVSISMSGSPFCFYWGFESNVEAEFQALALVKSLGIVTGNKSRMLERLYDVPAKEILKNMLALNYVRYASSNPTPPSAEPADIAWPDSGPQGKHVVLSPNPKIVAARPLSKRAAALEKLLRARYGTAFLNGCKTWSELEVRPAASEESLRKLAFT
ncbi:unnamed protein product [Trichogramma brassicae]|uniref:Carboxylesterase type B domain-containing protein n=1 Tax=Trichogramma brassicae TaxID=86971 RepID=A0A6H5IT93_9HYME|nr:unnamed protein product [Trichogramma brassicae]